MERTQAPALGRLVGPRFDEFARAWGAQPLLASAAERGGDDFGDVFSLGAVDELLTNRCLRTPFLRMAKEGSTLPESRFTLGGGVGAGVGDQVSEDRVRRLFAEGATVVLQALHRTWAPVTALVQQLAADLGHPVQANAYITPPQNRGFSAHYDIHDVFVLQVHGTKRWVVHPPVWPHPLRSQPWDRRADEVAAAAGGAPLLEATLAPGDCLYLPRGFIHSAEALGDISAHLTLGVHTWTGQHLAGVLLDAAGAALTLDEGVRASLPLGVDVADPAAIAADVERARDALIAALRGLDAEAVASALLAQRRAGQRPSPLPPLAQLTARDALGPDAVLRLRPHLLATLDAGEPGQVLVRSRAGRFAMPEGVRPALARLLGGAGVRVAELADDPAAALEAARTLLVEGVAVPA